MPLAQGKAKQTTAINFESEGQDQFLRLMRDGSLVDIDWVTAKALEGKVYGVHSMLLTTPDTFTAGGLTAAKPDLLVTVPTGTTIIPIYVAVGFEDTGAAAIMDVVAIASSVYDNAVTATAETIYNLRTDEPTGGSKCTAYSVVSANGTDPESGNFFEFWRPYAGFAEDAFNGSTGFKNDRVQGTQWSIGKAVVPPVIVGQGSLNVFASATAGTGFITAVWIEEATSNLT